MSASELRACAAYVEAAANAIEGADRGRELARLARRAAGDLDCYAKTAKLIEEADRRVVAVLMWLDERGRNSRSFGSHADAYEIAARKLREALSSGAPPIGAAGEAEAAISSTDEPSPLPAPDAQQAERDEALKWLLRLIVAMGGKADASEYRGSWVNAFCDDGEPDTFNRAIELGLTRSSHCTSFDTSTVEITDAGRVYLTPSAPRSLTGEADA